MGLSSAVYSSISKKEKKNLLQQKFFIFQEMKLFSYNIKKFQGRENPQKFLIFQENVLALILKNFRKTKPPKKFHIFQETGTFGKRNFSEHPPHPSFSKKIKNSYISGNENPKNFLYFLKRKIFLIFRRTKTSKKLFIFQETENLKKILMFQEGSSKA